MPDAGAQLLCEVCSRLGSKFIQNALREDQSIAEPAQAVLVRESSSCGEVGRVVIMLKRARNRKSGQIRSLFEDTSLYWSNACPWRRKSFSTKSRSGPTLQEIEFKLGIDTDYFHVLIGIRSDCSATSVSLLYERPAAS